MVNYPQYGTNKKYDLVVLDEKRSPSSQVIIHPRGTMNVCSNLHGYLANDTFHNTNKNLIVEKLGKQVIMIHPLGTMGVGHNLVLIHVVDVAVFP